MYGIRKYSVMYVCLLLLIAPLNKLFAASGSTAISFDFPNIIILHYFSNATLTFTGDIDTGNDEGSTSISTALGANVTFDATISPSDNPSIPDSVDVTLSNAWAVRGMTDSGDISVAITIDNDTATSTGGSTVTISNTEVSSGGSTGSSITVDAPGISLSNAVKGDVSFSLDMSGLTESVLHSGGQYTITAIAP